MSRIQICSVPTKFFSLLTSYVNVSENGIDVPERHFKSPAIEFGLTVGKGLSVHLFVHHTFVVSAQFQTNCSGDWSQTWCVRSLWYSTDLINFWSCSTEFLPFLVLIGWAVSVSISDFVDTLITLLHRPDKLLAMLHWIPTISWPLIGRAVSAHLG